jgi:hypothetical protein
MLYLCATFVGAHRCVEPSRRAPCAKGAKPQLQQHSHNVFVEMLQRHHAPMPSFGPYPSYDLVAHKVFIEMLEPWAEPHLQQ